MAYASSTWTTIRRRVGTELGLMRSGSITALTTTSATIPSLYLNTNRGGTQAQDETILYRPGATNAADYKRYIASITTSSGLATVAGGANYADTTSTDEIGEEWLLNIDPTVDVLDSANRALEYTMLSTFYAISNVRAGLDYDMQSSVTTSHTDILTPTRSKVTTARRTPYGRRSHRSLCAGAALEGFYTTTVGITKARSMNAMAIVSVDVGSMTFAAYDPTNSEVIGDAITCDEEEPMLLRLGWVTPTTETGEARLRFLGTADADDFYVNAAWLFEQGNRLLHMPAEVSERFKAPSIFVARPNGSTVDNNTYPVHSFELIPLVEGQDFTYRYHHPDANAYAVTLLRDGLTDWPLFVEALQPAADFGLFSTEASTTDAPAHVLVPRTKLDLIDHVLIPRLGASERWVAARAIAQGELDAALKVRATPVVTPTRRQWYGPSSGRI